jgi:phosphate acetyltransferase
MSASSRDTGLPAREWIENLTFDEIPIGTSATLERRLTLQDIKLFAAMSGDVNPAHLDEDYAKSSLFHQVIAHGMWGGALISTVLGTRLPGPGTIYLGQSLRFRRPVTLGDVLTVTVTARERDPVKHRVVFGCRCTNHKGEVVIDGEAQVIAPTEKVRRPRAILPDVRVAERTHLHRLLEHGRTCPPLPMAVAWPCTARALRGAVESARAGFIVPVLIGPEPRMRRIAEAEGLDLAPYRLIDCEAPHAAASAAVALVRRAEAEALMQGDLPTGALMAEVTAPGSGLGTERRMSHIFAFDVPTYARPLFITDAVLNVAPTLVDKAHVVQNAIDLCRALGIETPRVALLAARETVSPGLASTLDAAALCKMAQRGQIRGGRLDGPLGFDDAVSAAAAELKGIASPVAGQADILVVPDLESGHMLAKQLELLGDARCAGIVVGARVPVLLAGRADDPLTRLASCALAVVQRQRLAAGRISAGTSSERSIDP